MAAAVPVQPVATDPGAENVYTSNSSNSSSSNSNNYAAAAGPAGGGMMPAPSPRAGGGSVAAAFSGAGSVAVPHAAGGSLSSGGSAHLDFTERLSRKVLASLRSLNESLGEVRQSVAKIDHIAHQRLGLALPAAQPPQLPASAQLPNGSAPGAVHPAQLSSQESATVTTATSTTTLASPTHAISASTASGVAGGGVPPGGAPAVNAADAHEASASHGGIASFISAAAALLTHKDHSAVAAGSDVHGSNEHASTAAPTDVAATLRRVLLDPALRASGALSSDSEELLRRVLTAEELGAVKAHLTAHHRAHDGSDSHIVVAAVRAHTPPPPAWHSPSTKSAAGPSSGSKSKHTPGSVRFRTGDDDDDDDDAAADSDDASGGAADAHAGRRNAADTAAGPRAGGSGGGGGGMLESDDEGSVEDRSFHEALAAAKGRRPGSRPGVAVVGGTVQADEDSEDDDRDSSVSGGGGGGADTPLDADIRSVEARLAAAEQQPAAAGAALVAASGADVPLRRAAPPPPVPQIADGTHAAAAATVASQPAVRSPGAAVLLAASRPPPAPPRRAPPTSYTFPVYVDDDIGVDDTGEAEDVPVLLGEVSEAAFVAMEEEAAELKRMKAQLQAMRAQREAEKRAEASRASGGAVMSATASADAAPGSTAAAHAAAGAGEPDGSSAAAASAGDADGPARTPQTDGGDATGSSAAAPNAPPEFTIEDDEPLPAVSDWHGGDIEWQTAPYLLDGEGEASDAAGDGETETASQPGSAAGAAPVRPGFEAASGAPASRRKHPRFEAFALRVVYEAGRTGFEEAKDFQAPLGSVIAGRYQVRDYLGSAAFSSALSCTDLVTGDEVCLKVIKNNKDFVDQSLDEIKLLRYINAQGDADAHHVLRLRDYFYHREHLFLVTELLKDNLYEFQKYLADAGEAPYFTLPRVQRVAVQTLRALTFIHGKGLIHCDLKPENILIKSYSRCEVKLIDFGSSCFVTDHLSSYIQSRSYRAPEVSPLSDIQAVSVFLFVVLPAWFVLQAFAQPSGWREATCSMKCAFTHVGRTAHRRFDLQVVLGLPYGPKIDIWSLGCVLCELLTGRVLFANDSVQTMLARMQSLFGPFPQHMLDNGRDVSKYFTTKGVVYERIPGGETVTYVPMLLLMRVVLRDSFSSCMISFATPS